MPYRLDIPGLEPARELRAIELVAGLIPAGGHMVETGSGFGRTARAWAESCDPGVTVHCLDPWPGEEDGADAGDATPSLARFRAFTADCPNIVPHRGRAPDDFSDWDIPLELYFENAHDADPALSRSLDHWGRRLTERGILCGGGWHPERPDIRAATERMAARAGQSLVVVGVFWCLLPAEARLPGAEALRDRLVALAEGSGEAAPGGPGGARLAAAEPVTSLPGGAQATIRLVVSNVGDAPWPAGDAGPARLRATARRSGEAGEPAEIGGGPAGQEPLGPGDRVESTIALDLEQFGAGPVDIEVSLLAPDGAEAAGLRFSAVELTDPPVALGDFARRRKPRPEARRELRADDVVHAYRWILGREPEGGAVLETHLGAARNDPRRLRMALMRSAEFALSLDAAGLRAARPQTSSLAEIAPFVPGRPAGRPIVFLHLPKTGGTTVHYHLLSGRDPDRVCPQRHNDVLTAPALNLVGRDLVSGHYDARVLYLVPDPLLLTVLREPGRRLHSIYRYLRLTAPEREVTENQDLAGLARRNGFEAFLEEAARRNPGTVDNSYVRAFGGTLPEARWERSAEAEWTARHGAPSEAEWEAMLDRAVALLSDARTRILSFSNLEAEMRGFFDEIGTPLTGPVRNLKDTRSITEETVGFQPIDVEPYAPNPAVEHLVRHDRRLLERLGLGG